MFHYVGKAFYGHFRRSIWWPCYNLTVCDFAKRNNVNFIIVFVMLAFIIKFLLGLSLTTLFGHIKAW